MNDVVNHIVNDSCPICQCQITTKRQVVRAGDIAACSDCGTWYRVPRPSIEEIEAIYDESYYDAWGIDEDENVARRSKQATFLPLFKRIETRLTPSDDAPTILDVGAAYGLLLNIARDKQWDCYALEINPYAIDILRKEFGDEKIYDKDLTQCDFAEQSFDVITMTDLIEHSLVPNATLEKASKLLKPRGILCITTPAIDSLSRYLMGSQWLHFKEEHIQYYSRQGLKQSLLDNGFSNVEIYGCSKTLTFDYICRQLHVYPHRLLTPLIKILKFILPATARRFPLRYRCGEMLVIATV